MGTVSLPALYFLVCSQYMAGFLWFRRNLKTRFLFSSHVLAGSWLLDSLARLSDIF
jgi:hypothetical protein